MPHQHEPQGYDTDVMAGEWPQFCSQEYGWQVRQSEVQTADGAGQQAEQMQQALDEAGISCSLCLGHTCPR